MTDLLTRDEARKLQGDTFSVFGDEERIKTRRLCRDYLTLWDRYEEFQKALHFAKKARDTYQVGLLEARDRNKELEALIPKRLIQRVGGTDTR